MKFHAFFNKKSYKFLFIVFCAFMLPVFCTGCKLLSSLMKEEAPFLKQMSEDDLKGHTVTWLIFADDSDAAKSVAYKQAGKYFKAKSQEAGFAEKLQILVISDGVERAVKEKIKEAGFDADWFPLRANSGVKDKYNPGNKKNYSAFFDKNGRLLGCLTEDWQFENYGGLKDYAVEAAGLGSINELKNPLTLLRAVNNLKNDTVFDFVLSALDFDIAGLLKRFL